MLEIAIDTVFFVKSHRLENAYFIILNHKVNIYCGLVTFTLFKYGPLSRRGLASDLELTAEFFFSKFYTSLKSGAKE